MPSTRGQPLEGVQRLAVHDGHIVDAAVFLEPGMFRPDAGIVETGGNRVAFLDLPVAVLQQVGAVAVQHAGPPGGQRGAMLVRVETLAAGLDADDFHILVVEERMEQADGVGAAADGGDQQVGQAGLRPP